MNKIICMLGLLLALEGAAAIGLAAPAEGQMGSPGTTATAKPAKAFPFRGKILALDVGAKTVTLAGKEKNRIFQVTTATKITKDGKPATLEDAKVGDEVGGRALPGTNGKLDLVVLRVGPKPEAGKKMDDDDIDRDK